MKRTPQPLLLFTEASQLSLVEFLQRRFVVYRKEGTKIQGPKRTHEKVTYPVCCRVPPSEGIVQFGAVCKVAWFSLFRLTPARRKYADE